MMLNVKRPYDNQMYGRAFRPQAWHDAHNDPCDAMPVHIARKWAGLASCGHALYAGPDCPGCARDHADAWPLRSSFADPRAPMGSVGRQYGAPRYEGEPDE